MAAESGIGWTDGTVNFWLGCTRCGPGCVGCYAAAWAFNKWGIVFEPGGERRPTKAAFNDPLKWQRAHERLSDNAIADMAKPPPRWIFCNSLSDFFDKEAPAELRARAWAVIKACHHLRWQIVTKRIGLVERYLPDDWNGGKGYEHVGIIATMVDQPEYDRDNAKLFDLYRLGVRWTGISMEPQLSQIYVDKPTNWIITGGESRQAVWERNEQGVVVRKPHEPRPYELNWAVSLIEQCKRANTPLFIKQMGDNAQHQGKPIEYKAGGKDPAEWGAGTARAADAPDLRQRTREDIALSDTEERPQESKLRARMTEAHLAVSRAAQHCKNFPGAQATLLVRDLKDALSGLIEEIARR